MSHLRILSHPKQKASRKTTVLNLLFQKAKTSNKKSTGTSLIAEAVLHLAREHNNNKLMTLSRFLKTLVLFTPQVNP